MKKTFMCILMNLLGLGMLVAAWFMVQNNAPLFWTALLITAATSFLLGPYKPLVIFGVYLFIVLMGFAAAFVIWVTSTGMTEAAKIWLCLSLAGSSLICIPLPFIIGAIMEAVCGREEP